ncbi:MAG TPA: hypothetical protein VGG75_42470 [Trebonia sp.]
MATLLTLVSMITMGAAACGTASVPASAVHSGASPAPTTSATAPAPSRPVSPPPVVIPGGPGPVVPATTDCSGWPANAPTGTLTASFTPASVLRCVTGSTNVPGEGERQTATLERATSGLGPLADALRQPSGTRQPQEICPDYVVLTPQIVLVAGNGSALRPRFPVDSCGKIQPQVLTALAGLKWQTVSQHLISQVPASAKTLRGHPPGPGPAGHRTGSLMALMIPSPNSSWISSLIVGP